MSKMIALVGFIGSGKDTVANLLVEQGYVRDSFAHTLKDVTAVLFGWPRHLLEGNTAESRRFRETVDEKWAGRLGIPNFTPRYALQHLGTDVLRDHFHKDIWLLTLAARAESRSTYTVLSDARFSNELDFVISNGGKVIRVQRGADPEWAPLARYACLNGKKQEFREANPHLHISEWEWLSYTPDLTISNDDDLDSLSRAVAVLPI